VKLRWFLANVGSPTRSWLRTTGEADRGGMYSDNQDSQSRQRSWWQLPSVGSVRTDSIGTEADVFPD